MEDYILSFDNISKYYPGVVALNHVCFNLKKGEIHAIVGENGAGKSTLIKTCSGAVIPDNGKIIVDGKSFSSMTPQNSRDNGIAVIYQELKLVGDLSVAENIFLGRAIKKGAIIDKEAMVEKSKQLFEKLGIMIDPYAIVKDLTVGYQQIVEIAKAMSQNAKILIMDEPSASLTNQEVDNMLNMVETLQKSGVSIIYISHRLDEIFRLSNQVTVLRDGEVVVTLDTKDTNVEQLIGLMVGRKLTETFPKHSYCIKNQTLLETKNLSGNGVTNISFKIKEGEILGLGGLIGAGRTELAELIFGKCRKTQGKIYYKQEEIKPKSPREAIDLGIALVPEDRGRQGAILDFSVKNNISLPILKKISEISVINQKIEEKLSEEYRKELNIKTPSLLQSVRNLSGGNQQKVVLAKWLAAKAQLIILDEPTRGIDVGAKQEIYKLMNLLVENGKSILLITSELEELIGMSDRIIVMAEGQITGEIEKDDFSQEKVMHYASVSKDRMETKR